MRLPALTPTARRARMAANATKHHPLQQEVVEAVRRPDREARIAALADTHATPEELRRFGQKIRRKGRPFFLPLQIALVIRGVMPRDLAARFDRRVLAWLSRRFQGGLAGQGLKSGEEWVRSMSRFLKSPTARVASVVAAVGAGVRGADRIAYSVQSGELSRTFYQAAEARERNPRPMDPVRPRPWAEPLPLSTAAAAPPLDSSGPEFARSSSLGWQALEPPTDTSPHRGHSPSH